jgi:hypothetical protein
VGRSEDEASAREEISDWQKLREGVRRGILDALAQEIDRTSAGTVGRLAAAGALGVAGAVGSVALFSGDLLRNGHGWYLALCAAAWAGLMTACFAVILLGIRTQRIPLNQDCVLALLGLGLAAILGLLCPDRHHLAWWTSTPFGSVAVGRGGLGPGAFCLGACSALLVGGGATVIVALRRVSFRGAMLPGTLLFLMLWPAVVLQSADAPVFLFGVFGDSCG